MWFFRALYQMISGHLIREAEAKANNGSTNVTLSLKQETGNGDYFVVLALKSAGNYQYAHFTRPEFDMFAAEVAGIQADLSNL
ncbi:hypothetical protein [uncultured Roseibium sp.]|uniref:hypothetical protein n=1 Tax=uncultured Roseibium sp. TaxID=1936171 RepID=UPI003216DA26